MPNTRYQDLPLDIKLRCDDICRRYEQQWLSGEQPELAKYLEAEQDVPQHALLAELLLLEKERWLALAKEENVTNAFLVPTMLQRIVAYIGDHPDTAEAIAKQVHIIREPTMCWSKVNWCRKKR